MEYEDIRKKALNLKRRWRRRSGGIFEKYLEQKEKQKGQRRGCTWKKIGRRGKSSRSKGGR